MSIFVIREAGYQKKCMIGILFTREREIFTESLAGSITDWNGGFLYLNSMLTWQSPFLSGRPCQIKFFAVMVDRNVDQGVNAATRGACQLN